MLLINKAARCIDLRGKGDEKTYRLLPAGPAVEVPAAICKRKFVQNLIELGDIDVLEGSASKSKPKKSGSDDGKAAARATLKAEADKAVKAAEDAQAAATAARDAVGKAAANQKAKAEEEAKAAETAAEEAEKLAAEKEQAVIDFDAE